MPEDKSADALGRSKAIVEDTAYWEAVRRRLDLIAGTRGKTRKLGETIAVRLLQDMLGKLNEVEDVDRCKLPMMGECLANYALVILLEILPCRIRQIGDQDKPRFLKNTVRVSAPLSDHLRTRFFFHSVTNRTRAYLESLRQPYSMNMMKAIAPDSPYFVDTPLGEK
jgi:hypothetical protein